MIELVIAAILQIATISTDASATVSTQDASATTSVTAANSSTAPSTGGTGSWDDGN
jgi:hypothetical protein